jgi:hypothetical protein
MKGHFLATLAFLTGGYLTWSILARLHGFAAAQAAMSTVAVSGPPSVDTMIPWFICSYFGISGFGLLFAKNRGGLAIVATLAYLMLFIAYCMLCYEASGYDVGQFIAGILLVGILALIVLSPWHIIWYCLLFMNKRDDPA